MSLCKSIDTLSMAYLDDELAAEERHELEAHLTECASCRAHLERERTDQSLVRRALVAPAAPDLLRERLARALAREEREESRAQRRRWYQYLLPGSAMVAAAAAIVMFVGVQAPSQKHATTVHQAARQGTRALPLEVQGPSTGPWLRANFSPTVAPPEFVEPGVQLLGARLFPGGIDGHDAAAISYQLNLNGNPFVLSVLVVRDVGREDWQDGKAVNVNGRTVHVLEADDGTKMVSYVDDHRMGYLFIAPALSTNELVWLVGRTDLVVP
jgi:anti-sigma factor RsiW